MTYHSEAYLLDLIQRVDDVGDDADALLRRCAEAPLAHGVRAGVLRGVEELVRERAPHRLPRLIEFLRLFSHQSGALPAMAFVPVVDFHLILMQAARLIYPDLPLEAAMRQHALEGCLMFFENPLFRIATRAIDHDLSRCLEALIQGASAHLFNYGRRELERVGPRSYRFAFYDDHPWIFGARIPPFMEQLVRRLQRRGEVTFEAVDEGAFAVGVRWD
jgi:uncharacterized protein (TIGR02265 family)